MIEIWFLSFFGEHLGVAVMFGLGFAVAFICIGAAFVLEDKFL